MVSAKTINRKIFFIGMYCIIRNLRELLIQNCEKYPFYLKYSEVCFQSFTWPPRLRGPKRAGLNEGSWVRIPFRDSRVSRLPPIGAVNPAKGSLNNISIKRNWKVQDLKDELVLAEKKKFLFKLILKKLKVKNPKISLLKLSLKYRSDLCPQHPSKE